MAFRYTEAMKAFLKTGFLTLDYQLLTQAFNAEFGLDKTPGQINSALKNYGYRSGPEKVRPCRATYSNEQLAWLREHYPLMPVSQLTPAFNAAFATDKTPVQIYGCVKRNKIKSGHPGHFQKGNRPWNAGLKGWQAPGKSHETRFKKGASPKNLNPIGHEYVGKDDGYVYIKTDQTNPYTGARGWYRQKQLVTWEQHQGPVPKGHCVLIKDGNKRNCSDINNLMLVTRRQLAQLNKTGLIAAPAELKEAAVATVELTSQLRRIERQQKQD
jgi:hypothetical protein